ncbi:hypothetical protein [Ponticaulis sp.]|uniref:hypothetical protein n=1 Tax=Ponticaulis sp. TaxID=2020902 RepID=UPI000B671FEF|nr:hypothetical protein [Ponticaulis sp.]MAI89839.1 hypothetical protein [Ponticaulis sp.]OUX99514.1 MAG: hypothetical protein CBB65_05310 [Hyphomonadaceae bacterium TMED5]|tara:strand:- start:70882 stop:72597 length:1716 start_codon:yes stop_codon:yes gene_type:complete
MGGRETHFELFLRKTPKAGWALVDATPNRAAAIEKGKKLLASNPQGGVRVVKEERSGKDNSYNSIIVTTLGNCEAPRQKKSRTFIPEETSSCLSPTDLRSSAARKTYLQVMPRFLERHRVLPGELVYRTDLLETLEASGSEITQAIQRVAISRAGTGEDTIHAIARKLHELVNQGINEIFKAKRAGGFVSFDKTLAQVVAECRTKPNMKTAFLSAVSDRLMRETTWEKKLNGLISIWDEAKELTDEDRKFVNGLLSDFFSEWIDTPGAINSILGEARSTGEHVDRMIALLEKPPEDKLARDPLRNFPAAQKLADAVQRGLLPSAHQTIVSRVFEEIASNRRLFEDSLKTEFQMLKNFGDRLVRILLANRHSEMYEAFCARSKRLMSTDTVDAYLEQYDILERPLRLLELQDNLVGTDGRLKMASLIRGIIGQPRFEESVMNASARQVNVLMTLRATQITLLNSELPEADRIQCAERLDALGMRLISGSKILASVARRAGSPALAAVALFRLACEAMPRGQCAMLAASAGGKLLSDGDVQESLRENQDMKLVLRELSQKAREASMLQAEKAA